LGQGAVCSVDGHVGTVRRFLRTSHAWLLAQKRFVVPIPGTGKVKHLEENIEATNLVLTAEDLKEIDRALSEFKVHGGRMNEQQMKVVEQ